MVTQTVLHITTYGDIVAAAAVSPSSSAAVDVPPQNTSIKNVSKQLQTQSFNNESRTDSTQQPSQLGWTNGSKNYKPCGLIQLCCYSGCVNVANFTRGYGFCNLHQAESMAAEQRKNYSEDPQYDKCIRDASSHSHHGGFHTRSAYESKFPPRQVYNTGISLYNSEGSTDNAFSDGGCDSNSGRDDDSFDYASPEVEKKGALPSENFVSEKQVIKHQRCSAFTPNHEHQRCSTFTPFTTVTEPEPERERLDRLIMDLSGVPMQSPIPKRGKRINSSTSKYEGVSFYKRNRQWVARIMIERKAQVIGYYNSEEDAGIDYARAVFKYRGQEGLDEKRGQRSAMLNASPIPIDLSGVPMQAPILKSGKGAQSKYQGVYFDKDRNKWWAQIIIGRKGCHIGSYDNEEDAARAVSKYRSRNEVDCNVEQAESMTGEQRHSGESQENASDKSISDASLDEDLSDSCSGHGGDSPAGGQTSLELEREDALSLKLKNSMGRNEVIKHKRCDAFNTDSGGATKRRRLNEFALQTGLAPWAPKVQNKAVVSQQRAFPINLRYVPPQPPILKTGNWVSKYEGDFYNREMNRPTAQFNLEGTPRYARTVSVCKDKGQKAIDNARAQHSFTIDLSDVPQQSPVLRRGIKEGTSQYQGVCFNKRSNKWLARITIEGKERFIGGYENEEDAAIDYARALFKYRGETFDKVRVQDSFTNDLSDAPQQSPILRTEMKEGQSKYQGVCFEKASKKWIAQIFIEGKSRYIGRYENEEDAAADYARAVFKYRGRNETLDDCNSERPNSMAGEQSEVTQSQRSSTATVDMSDLSLRTPIKEGACQNETLDDCDNMKLADPLAGEQSDLDEPTDKTEMRLGNSEDSISDAKSDGDPCDRNSAHDSKCPSDKIEEKRVLSNDPSEKEVTQQRSGAVAIESDMPSQPLIAKSLRHGVCFGIFFDKKLNQWVTRITIERKLQYIVYYESEEEAAADYARAVLKHKGQGLEEEVEHYFFNIDLSDVPMQAPILTITEGQSKYQGVSFEKGSNKWRAQITIEGKERFIGCYDSEEDAAIDYARAVFKYKGRNGVLHDCNSEQSESKAAERRQSDEAEDPGDDAEMRLASDGVMFNRNSLYDSSFCPPRKIEEKGTLSSGDSTCGSELTQSQGSSAATVDMSDLSLRTPIKEGACQNETIDDCDVKLVDPLADEQSDLDEPADNTKMRLGNSEDSISDAKSDGDLCDRNLAHDSKCPSDKIEEKRVFSNDPSGKEVTHRQRPIAVAIDLRDVPSQPLIAKNLFQEAKSKYKGVVFDQTLNQWVTTEENAAAAYFRAWMTFRGRGNEILDACNLEQTDSVAGAQKDPAEAFGGSNTNEVLPMRLSKSELDACKLKQTYSVSREQRGPAEVFGDSNVYELLEMRLSKSRHSISDSTSDEGRCDDSTCPSRKIEENSAIPSVAGEAPSPKTTPSPPNRQ